jgi:hypothetical protein
MIIAMENSPFIDVLSGKKCVFPIFFPEGI